MSFEPLPTVAGAAAEAVLQAAVKATPTVAPAAAAAAAVGLHPQITTAETTTLAVRDGRRKGKGKGAKDSEQIAAAAAAAEGIRQRRAEAGLGCKVCGLVFANRNLLLKHIEKTGHITDPTRKTGVITGLYYIPPTEPVLAGEKRPKGAKKKWRNFAQKEDSDSD